MKETTRRGIMCFVLGLLCFGSVPWVRAQEVTPVSITKVRGHVELGYEQEDDSREQTGVDQQIKSKDRSFLEELGMGFDGYIYHPRFLDVKADATMVHQQRSDSSNLQFEENVNDRLFNYSFFMNMLKAHPLSLQFAANQSFQDTNSSFFESRRLMSKREAASARYRHEEFPTQIGYDTRRSKGEGLDLTDDKIDTAYVNVENESELGRSHIRYENEEKKQAVGNIRLLTDTYNFSNFFQFGSDDRHALSSLVRFRDQEGSTDIQDTSVGESLYFRNTENLNSYYFYTYDDSKLPDQVTTSYQHRVGVKHHLFESLTSGLEFRNRKFHVNSGTEDTVGTDLFLNYQKQIPVGRLVLNYRTILEREDENLSGDLLQVLREEHLFGENPEGNDVILLNHDLVITGSIVLLNDDETLITDPGTGIPIEEGIHYRVESAGTLTKIRLLPPDGDFLLGRTVLVNYEVELSPALEFTTHTQLYGARLVIKKIWTIFYDAGTTDQTFVSGVDLDRLEDTRHMGFGTEVVWKNSTTRAEKRIFRSRRNPYQRTTFSEGLQFRLTKTPFLQPILNLGASYGESSTTEDAERSIDRMLMAKLSLGLRQQIRWDLETRYRNQDLIGEKQEETEHRTNLRWKYRKLNMILSYQYVQRRRDFAGDEDRSRIFFRVKRSFDFVR
jgi:hypothetical protein